MLVTSADQAYNTQIQYNTHLTALCLGLPGEAVPER